MLGKSLPTWSALLLVAERSLEILPGRRQLALTEQAHPLELQTYDQRVEVASAILADPDQFVAGSERLGELARVKVGTEQPIDALIVASGSPSFSLSVIACW